MITKQEFEDGAKAARFNLTTLFPKMVSFKSYIQKAILDIASSEELGDVCNCRINYGMIDKLCLLAKNQWVRSENAETLYCAAMAVATIIKEYDWGTQYISGDGLWWIADKIQKS